MRQPVPTRRGLRVRLALPRPRDQRDVLALNRKSRAFHAPWVTPPRTPAQFAHYLARCRAPHCVGLLIRRNEDDALIGSLELSQIVRGRFQNAYLGYQIGAPFARQGYMTEALGLVLAYAFRQIRLHRLEANIQPENTASIALVERLGFRREGYSPRYLKLGGRWRDHQRWAILAEDWRSRGRDRPSGAVQPSMRVTISLVALCVLVRAVSPTLAFAQDTGAALTEPTSRCNFRSSPHAYFPPGALSPTRADLDVFEQCWYGGQLKAMSEPVLHTLALPADAEVYRFTWLRTFHHPIAVRIERRGENARLVAIELDGAGGYAPGKPARRIERALSKPEWAEFRRALDRVGFWDLSTTSEQRGLDGAQWILEGRTPDRYHVAVRWTPDADGQDASFRATCIHMLSLADLLPQNEVY